MKNKTNYISLQVLFDVNNLLNDYNKIIISIYYNIYIIGIIIL